MTKYIRAILIAIVAMFYAAPASAQSYYQAYELRDDFDDYLRKLSPGWVLTYRGNSVGTPEVTAVSNDGEYAVIRASYRYTNGQSDTIYVGFGPGGVFCLAYAYYNEYCTLRGKVSGDGPSYQQGQVMGALLGAIIVEAMRDN